MMENKCGKCGEVIAVEEKYIIRCGECGLVYHDSEKKCSSLTYESWYKKSPDNKLKWTCSNCPKKQTKRKTGNENDSGDECDVSLDDGSAITAPSKVRMMSVNSNDDQLLAKISNLIDQKCVVQLTTINTGIDTIQQTLQEQKDALTAINTRVNDLEKRVEIVENKNPNIEPLISRLQFVEAKLENLENYSRRNNIVFTGIPFQDNEDPYEIAIRAASLVGFKLNRADIVNCHWLPGGNNSAPFIVKFVNFENKQWILREYRKQRPTADAFGGNKNDKVYANEHYAPFTSSLHKHARQLPKDQYKVECRRGTVTVQKRQGGPKIVIYNHSQVDGLLRVSEPSHSSPSNV